MNTSMCLLRDSGKPISGEHTGDIILNDKTPLIVKKSCHRRDY